MIKHLWILIVILVSCHRGQEKNENKTIIRVGETVGTGEILNLSDYAKSVEYIPLETNDNVLVGDIESLIYEDGHIILYDKQTNMCKLFGDNGNFKTQLGKYGQGPGEYLGVRALSYIPKTKNVFLDLYPLNYYLYDLDGNLKETLSYVKPPEPFGSPTTVAVDKNLYLSHLVAMGDSRYWALLWGRKDTACIYKLIVNTVSKEIDENARSISITAPKWRFKNDIRCVWDGSDTIYTIGRELEMKNAFVLDLGRYKIPDDQKLNRKNRDLKYISPLGSKFCESTRYLFMPFNFYQLAPEAFSHVVRNPHGGTAMVRETYVYGLFDKDTGKLTLLDQPVKHKYLGFKNDLDGGPCFWPKYVSSDDKMVTWWLAEEFLDIYRELPDPSPELKKVAEKLTPDDNPVLMVVTLK